MCKEKMGDKFTIDRIRNYKSSYTMRIKN